jgi:DNA-binding GntR family transcriptional regulator
VNSKIYKELKERIIFMEYEPGQILKEQVLAKQFGVSRTPVREAFLRLEWEKLVDIIPRGGVFVKKIEFQPLRDVFLIRIYVEGLVAKLATINITESHIEEIKKLKEKCNLNIETNKPEELIEIDIKLREIMHFAANSPTLSELSNYLYFQTLRIWYSVFEKSGFYKEVEVQMKEIDEIIMFLTKKDPQNAEKCSQNIIKSHVERIKKYFGFFD